MTIEFQTPYGKVSEKLIAFLRNEILNLSHKIKNISRAEVLLKNDAAIFNDANKMCRIKLTMPGTHLSAQHRTENFEKSAREAINELNKNRRLSKH